MKKLRGELKQDALLDGGHRYCGVAAAMIGAAVIGGVAANSAASKQAKAANHASDISNSQYQQTRADQLAELERQRADSAPYRQAGYGALDQLVSGTAKGGEFNRAFTMSDMVNDPGYAFREKRGELGINRAAIAGGGRYSGATLKALAGFNSDLASQEFGNAYSRYKADLGDRFNRLSGIAGTGQTAVTQAGNAGNNAYGNIANAGNVNATNMGNNVQNAAAARASGYVGVANSVNNSLGQYVNHQQQMQYLNQLNQPNNQPTDYSAYESEGYGGPGPLY